MEREDFGESMNILNRHFYRATFKSWKQSPVYHRDQRESWKNLNLDNFSLISSNLGLDNHENCSLGRVSISTILKSESRPDLDLDSLGNISLVPISISTIF